MSGVRSAILLSLIERYLLLVLALGGNMVIARLLVPDQIGVYSVSMAVLGIAQALRDFGIGSYLIQERELGEDQIRTAYGVSLALGGLLFCVVFVAAPWVAAYYGEPRMAVTLRITALNFLLLPFSTVSLSLLRRDMQFRRLLYVTLGAASVATAVSVAVALQGLGENSLALGAVAGNVITGFGAWLARRERRLLRPGFGAWRSVLRFGGQSSLASLVTSVSMDANDLVVGKILGFHSVAMLSRAQGLMNVFHRDLMAAVRNVALPAFAAAHRQGADLSEPFLRSVALVVVFAWPFYGLISIYGLEVLNLLYGPQWWDAASLVPVFCAAGAAAAINALTPNLMVAMGRIDLLTRVELLMQPLRLIFIVAAALLFRSVMACAWAYLASALLTLPVMWRYKRLCVEDDRPTRRRYLISTAIVTAAVLLLPLLHVTWMGWQRTEPIVWWQWLAVIAVSTLLGMFAASWTSHPLAQEPTYRKAGVWVRWLSLRPESR